MRGKRKNQFYLLQSQEINPGLSCFIALDLTHQMEDILSL